MKPLLGYLLQVIITSGILYSYYHFVLRNKKFHRYNRFYLLAAASLSIIIPFFNIPLYFAQSQTDSSFILQTLTIISSGSTGDTIVHGSDPAGPVQWFTWSSAAILLYMLIAFVMLLRIIFSLLKIRRMIRSHKAEELGTIHLINTAEPGTPFSFFRWLFWNKKIELHSEKGEQIFRHELFHIEQKHSRDSIFMEILTFIFWINPFFHLVKKELKAIHEFLADQFAVSENTKWQYAELLLMQAFKTNQHLVNPFFHTQIKRRIAMITTSKKPSYQYVRKLMVLPVTAIVVSLFAFTYYSKKNEALKKITVKLMMGTDTIPVRKSEPEKTKQEIIKPDTISPKKLSYLGTLMEALKEDLRTCDPLIIIDGLKQKSGGMQKALQELKAERIITVNVLKGPEAISAYGEEGKNGVIEIHTKKENGSNYKTVPDAQVNIDDPVKKQYPDTLAWLPHAQTGADDAQGEPKYLLQDVTVTKWRTEYDKVLIVIDGVINPDITATALDKYLRVEDIETVTIWKGEKALAKYGEKGKYNVIEIVTKKVKQTR